MAESTPSVFRRLSTALATFWRILVHPQFAATVAELRLAGPAGLPGGASTETPSFSEVEPSAALQLLGLLQQEGRFIDFLEEDVTAYADEEVGAAARVVHEGCKKTLRQHFVIEPVRSEAEGERVTLAEGFDSSAVRVTGNVVGRPPFSGSLAHAGWRVTESKLPKVAAGHDLSIVAPAEVEL